MSNHNDIRVWLGRRPGVFEAPTEREVWDKAWKAFSGEDRPGSGSFEFMMYVGEAGFEVRPTTLGGYILDTKP